MNDSGMFVRLLGWAARPLSFYWVLALILLVVGIGSSIAQGAIAWEPLAGAAVLAGVIHVLAHVTGVPAWPWSRKAP